ncbi:hypothetical protein JCM3770_000823 [Rhodotorula araucariae]
MAASGPSPPQSTIPDLAKHSSASVSIDGKPVDRYEVEHVERKTTCFIKAVGGREYKVKVMRDWKTTDLTVLSIDGVRFGEAKHKLISSTRHAVRRIDTQDLPFYSLEFEVIGLAAACSPQPAASTSSTNSESVDATKVPARKKCKSSLAALEDENEDLRAKIARLEAESSQLKDAGVRREVDGEYQVKPRLKGEQIGKVSTENGRTVIDLLDEDDD